MITMRMTISEDLEGEKVGASSKKISLFRLNECVFYISFRDS